MPAPAQTSDLFLLDDLQDTVKTTTLTEADRDALQTVADWMRTYVIKPNPDLGRAGPVCPFVPVSLDRKTLWLAAEQLGDRDGPAVAELMDGYRRLLLDAAPTDGDAAAYPVIVVVFPQLSPDRAPALFDDVAQRLAVPAYAEYGIIYGPFYPGHQGTAIHNAEFRPFRSPVPFMFVRQTVVEDWEFFLNNDDYFDLWAHRFGQSATHALAQRLRRLPWREGHDQTDF
jgi:hypothetical protein